MQKKIIQRAMARILFTKIMENFDDTERLTDILKSKEYNILRGMQDILDSMEDTEDQTICVDYDLVISAWLKFLMQVEELNNKNSELLSKIKSTYQISIDDQIVIFGSLIAHDMKVLSELEEADKNKFKEYFRLGNEIILKFKIDILTYNSSDLVDEFFDHADVISDKYIDYHPIELKETVIYLDQNAVSSISKDEKFMNQCMRGVEENKISFVYSSYLIEDSINMNPIFLKDFLKDLENLTKNKMIEITGNGLNFVTENIKTTILRVSKYSKPTKLGEKHRLIKFMSNYYHYPDLRKGKAFNNGLKNGLTELFSNPSKLSIPGFDIVSSKFLHSDFLSNFISTGEMCSIPKKEIMAVTDEIIDFFDFINFETESIKVSNHKKIASSYRDNRHLARASIADFFISDDSKIKSRGNALYPLIGSKTKVVNFKEFHEKLPELLQNF